ncbi:MAG: hypothetical protein U5K43_06885 [Halofilum sp. (in: g-proteobacteria)]|nr:hypothetical protein [Halofilum sp. (in: g-proteobacteria)]
MRWLPWQWVVRRAARAYGIIDPLAIAARMRRFSQPSEVAEPLELLRAGIVFHARGLVNTKAIQHNLDWVWPYWVVRQFDPADPSFIPRAFSFSHVNLTHRNWTAVGLPDCPHYPIVDPRGLLTPLYDGWSIDCWLVSDSAAPLLPARMGDVEQQLELEPRLAVRTLAGDTARGLQTTASVRRGRAGARVELEVEAHGEAGDWLAVAIRPYNPEGVQFIDRLAPLAAGGVRVNDATDVHMDPALGAVALRHLQPRRRVPRPAGGRGARRARELPGGHGHRRRALPAGRRRPLPGPAGGRARAGGRWWRHARRLA